MGAAVPAMPLPHGSGAICQHLPMSKASCPLPVSSWASHPPAPPSSDFSLSAALSSPLTETLSCSYLTAAASVRSRETSPSRASILTPWPRRWSSKGLPGARLPTPPLGGFQHGPRLSGATAGGPRQDVTLPSWEQERWKPRSFTQDTGMKLPAEHLINSALN